MYIVIVPILYTPVQGDSFTMDTHFFSQDIFENIFLYNSSDLYK